jgi:type I restriction enzyme, S subunit
MSSNGIEFIECRLDDIAEIHNYKRRPLNSRERENMQGQYPYYGASGIFDYLNDYIFDGEYVLISEDGENLKSRKTPIAFKVDGKFWVNNHAHIVKGKEELINEFIVYYFANLDLNPFVTGAVQPKLNKENLLSIPIFMPKKPEIRNQFVSVLKSIDDKIENNLATNQTLEEIARTLFKEWFVNFNYPNADGNLKHSEFGEIPESWSIGTLGDIYRTTSGGTPSRSKSEYYENGTIGWVKSKELNNSFIIDTEEKITEDALKNSSAKLLPKHSVLIAMYGATVGEIGVTTKEFTCNQAICSFLPNENYPFSFIYNSLLHSKQDIIGRAVGSAQQNISQQVLLQFKLVIPPSELVQEYHRIVFPLFQKIQDNIEENESLRDLRDSLLPKLMSGEIDVNPSNAQ